MSFCSISLTVATILKLFTAALTGWAAQVRRLTGHISGFLQSDKVNVLQPNKRNFSLANRLYFAQGLQQYAIRTRLLRS